MVVSLLFTDISQIVVHCCSPTVTGLLQTLNIDHPKNQLPNTSQRFAPGSASDPRAAAATPPVAGVSATRLRVTLASGPTLAGFC